MAERNIDRASILVGRIKAMRQDVIDLQAQLSLDLDFMGAGRGYCEEKIDETILQLKELKRQLKAIEKHQKNS